MEQRKRFAVIAAMCMGIFLCMLDTTIMNITLPAIQAGFKTDLSSLSWALNVYTILFASLSIPLGRVGEILGLRRTYVVGLSLFIVGSLCSGMAWDLSALIAFRALQSLGAAIVFPSSMTIGISTASKGNRTNVIAALGVTQGLASALGPVIGGLIAQYLGWRWVFYVNVPIGLTGLCICLLALGIKGERKVHASIDWAGSACLMGGLFALVLALVKGTDWGWGTFRIVGLLAISAIAFLAFVGVERKVTDPMIDVRLFGNRQFDGAVLVMFLGYFFLVGITVLLPTFFTKIQGSTEVHAAIMVTPVTVMIFLFSPLSGFLLKYLGPRILLLIGFVALAAGYLLFGRMNPDNTVEVVAAGCLVGAGFGMIVGPITILSAADFTGRLLTASQSVTGVIGRVGTALAVAVFVSVLTGNIAVAKTQAIEDAAAKVNSLAGISPRIRGALLKGSIESISNERVMKAGPANHVGQRQRQKLIDDNTVRMLQGQHLQSAAPAIKRAVKDQVTKHVDQEIAATNKTINAAIQDIATSSESRFKQAFMGIYRFAALMIPFGMVTIALFPRKRMMTTL